MIELLMVTGGGLVESGGDCGLRLARRANVESLRTVSVLEIVRGQLRLEPTVV